MGIKKIKVEKKILKLPIINKDFEIRKRKKRNKLSKEDEKFYNQYTEKNYFNDISMTVDK
jgi:hypothetical protein